MTQVQVADSPAKTAITTWLRLPCCDVAVHSVQIERHESNRIDITAPVAPHTDSINLPDPDTVVLLGWSDAGGTFTLSCRVDPASTAEQWILNVENEGNFIQRRQHVRVATTAPVQLLDHRRDLPVAGTLLDLSEGGMRCQFNEWLFEGDDDVYRIAIQLNGTVIVVDATPMWSGQADGTKVYVGFEFAPLHYSIVARIRSHVAEVLARS